MKIVCDECSAKYSIADEKVRGKVFKIRCKKCSNIIVVRGSSDDAAAAADQAPAQEQPPVDNKETKVFDYAGYDSPQDAMAAAEGGDAVWHVVIDQEQVGPMTAGEVQERFAAAQIDVESYIWKEGFADWQRLGDVPEFASLSAGGAPAAHEDPSAGMFGGPALDDGGGAQSDPADLFASATGGGADAGSDLFGGAAAGGLGAASAADEGGLFGGATAGDPGGDPVISSESQLRGQRSENSVLFSLNNLASLASDAPKAASPAPSAAPQPGMAGPAGTEGSGLIDIRSMAQVYLGDKGRPAAAPATGSADDLPVFSQTAFESASPVLLPAQAQSGNNKLIYGLVGAIGVLVVAATILIVVVLKGGDDDAAPRVAESAAAAALADEAGDSADDGEPAPAAAAADDGADDGSDDEAEAAAAAAADEEPTEPEKAAAEPEKSARTASAARKTTRSRSTKTRSRAAREPKPEPKKPDPVREATTSGGCDEVACLVEPDKACCRKYNKRSGGGGGGGGGSSSNLPETLTRSDISKGIGKVRSRVTSCGDQHGGSGTVKVKIKIGGDGRVKSADASGGSSSLRSCVTSAVKRASFRKTQKGMTVTYPFVFR